MRKTQFPRLVIPLSVVLTALFTLGLNMIIVFVFMIAFGVTPMWTWLLFPVDPAAAARLVCALAMLLSALNVRFRDVAIIWIVIATALNYAHADHLPAEHRQPDRRSAHPDGEPADADLPAGAHLDDRPGGNRMRLGCARAARCRSIVAALIYVAVCVAGVWVFNREAPRIAEQL